MTTPDQPTPEAVLVLAATTFGDALTRQLDEGKALLLAVDAVWSVAAEAAEKTALAERELGIAEGLRRADNAITWGVTCLGCADQLDGLIAERAAGHAEGVADGRSEALTAELAHSEGCAAALDRLPGQQQAAAFYRLHAEHVRAVLARETPEGAVL